MKQTIIPRLRSALSGTIRGDGQLSYGVASSIRSPR
jgi:hypothetical protein